MRRRKAQNSTIEGNNLAQLYENENNMVKDTIHQVVGYQVKYMTEYGLITNYRWTWITRLTQEGIFFISKAFGHDEVGSQSTLNALLFAVCTALNSKRNSAWVSPSLESIKTAISADSDRPANESADAATGSDQSGGKVGTSSTASTNIRPGAGAFMLRLESVMQRHPDRITYMARAAEDSALVVVKCYACCEHRDSEASFYRTLALLQGAHIPRYLGSGLLGDERTSRRFALILSRVGDDLEGGEHTPSPHAWKQARETLIQIHALGVVDGDLEPQNVTYDKGSGRLFFCDFSDALTNGALGPAKFAAARAKELESFDRLALSATPDSAEEASLSLPLLNLARAAAPAKGIDCDFSVGCALQAVTPRLPSRNCVSELAPGVRIVFFL